MHGRPVSHPLALERLADAMRPTPNLLAAAIAIATHHDPQIKPQTVTDFLDRMAADAKRMIALGSAPAGVLKHVMFDRYGFVGNHRNYHDPLNSYIDSVIQRRMGLPILLSLIYVELSMRAGFGAHGIGLPSHFIAAIDLEGKRTYLDPFDGGRELTIDDCKRISLAGSQFWAEALLTPVTPQAWMTRMLNNLRNTYAQMGDTANTAAVLEQLLIVDPQNAVALKELAEKYRDLNALRSRDN